MTLLSVRCVQHLLVAQDVCAYRTCDKTANRTQSSTTELVTQERTTSAANKG
jgi:hypothetical protein